MKRTAARLAGLLMVLVASVQACGGSADDTSIPPEDDAGAGPDTGTRSDATTADGGGDETVTGDSGGDGATQSDVTSSDGSGGDVMTGDAPDDVTTSDAPDDVTASDGGPDASGDADDGSTVCPPPDNSDTERHLYVDQGAAAGGNGSIDCPFRTILAATTLGGAVPAGSQLTIHVKGDANVVVYDESACVPVGPRTLLTSDYPGGSGPDPTTVYVRGQSTLQGTKCVVRVTGGTLEGVRVVAPTGSTGVNGVVAESGATVRLVSARNNTGAGVVTLGSVTLGPGLYSVDNDGDGVTVNMAASGKGAGPVVTVVAGGRGNRFENNGGHGLHATDRYGQLVIQAASASNNQGNGVLLEAEANTVHEISTLDASNNGATGLRVTRGSVAISGGTFEGNITHGVHLGNGTAMGTSFTIENSTANGNGVDGVRLDTMGTVQIKGLTARNNAQTSNGSGLYIAHGTSAKVRTSVFLENTVGVFFDEVRNGSNASSALDIGTSGSDLGGNAFGASSGGVKNARGGLCILNSGGLNSQKAVGDEWSSCPVVQVPIVSVGQNTDCYDAATYGDVIYLPANTSAAPVDTGGTSSPACAIGNF